MTTDDSFRAAGCAAGVGCPRGAWVRGVTSWAVGLACATLAVALAADAAPRSFPEPRLTFLDNGEVKVGMDLALGGAVTFLSSRDHPGNLINSADLGRQIQMSHYSGPWPFEPNGKKPDPHWAGLGWNPIQTGDCHLNPAKVVEHRNDGRELYIKCIPMQWPHDNVPGDCLFETWTRLDGPVIQMRFRCTNQREDTTFYRPCAQELPAVYTLSKLWRLMAYVGDQPFTGAPLTHVTNDWRKPWPWTRFTATERWAALVDDQGWGLGVFKDDGGEFHGGIHGDGRSSDPKHGSTAYVAPIHRENFDHNLVYEHETTLMVGRLEDLRRRFNALATPSLPAWRFHRDRQHWTLHHATDGGFPLKGEWRVRLGDRKPRLEGPTQCWRAEAAPVLELEVAYAGSGSATTARVYWKRLGEDHYDPARSLTLSLPSDGVFHTHRLDVAASPEYRGLITGLAFEPVAEPQPGGQIAVRSIALRRERPAAEETNRAEAIRRLRMGTLVIQAAPGAEVEVEQLRHEFWFGAALANAFFGGRANPDAAARYKQVFLENFNAAVTENALKWHSMEVRPGEVDYTLVDAMLAWTREHGLPLRGHNVFWGIPNRVQPWLKTMDDATLRQTLEARARDVARRYRGQFAEYDLNNEMLHANYYEERLGSGITRQMADWMRQEDPHAVLYLNDYDILTGRRLEDYVAHIRAFLDQGVPVGGIGVQGHLHGDTFDPAALQQALDRLTQFQLPIRVTEFNFPGQRSKHYGQREARLTDEEELAKAKALTDYYRICFAHPAVEGILMWGFWEGANWIPVSSLYRRDWSPTPAALAYRDLVYREWWTTWRGKADAQGRCEVRAFFGRHRVKVGGQEQIVELPKAEPRKLVSLAQP